MARVAYVLVGGKKMDAVKERARLMFASGGLGQHIANRIMRRGPGSIDAQFGSGGTAGASSGFQAWPRTRPFGNFRPGKNMVRTGAYRSGWLGGGGSVTIVNTKSVSIGVDPSRFPQARVFQRRRNTIVRARTRTAGGRLAMQLRLGFGFGAWVREATLLRGLVLRPRRLALGGVVVKRARKAITKYLATGKLG